MNEPKVRIYYQNKHLKRRGKGFSINELSAAALSIGDALWMGLPVDVKRKSEYEENIAILTSIMQRLDIEVEAATPAEKKPKESNSADVVGVPLEEIPGVGPKTAERLREAGYMYAGDICEADVSKLAEIKGISKKSAEDIIEKARSV